MPELDERYADGSYLQAHPEWHSFRSVWKAEQVMLGLQRISHKPTSICDIGCGTGLALAEVARRLGAARAVGFEPSPDAPLDPTAGPMIERRSDDVTECKERFELAMMLDVFEHIEDDYGFLRKCRKLSDIHVLHIPLDAHCFNLLNNGLDSPRREHRHLHFYTRRSALATLQESGYEILHWHYTSPLWEAPRRRGNRLRPLSLMRRAVSLLSKEYCSLLLGGLSLLVVARPR